MLRWPIEVVGNVKLSVRMERRALAGSANVLLASRVQPVLNLYVPVGVALLVAVRHLHAVHVLKALMEIGVKQTCALDRAMPRFTQTCVVVS
jgi:hypothetical protein